MKSLLLGCGSRKEKRIWLHEKGQTEKWEGELVCLDFVSTHKPDVVHDLNIRPLPFLDNDFDEIHAYEILEHLGKQGDWKEFFQEWKEYWRILKSGGLMFVTVPHWNSMAAWGDPSHTRIINPMTLSFLSQKVYANDIGKTVMSDFRGNWSLPFDFELKWAHAEGDSFSFVLKKLGGE